MSSRPIACHCAPCPVKMNSNLKRWAVDRTGFDSLFCKFCSNSDIELAMEKDFHGEELRFTQNVYARFRKYDSSFVKTNALKKCLLYASMRRFKPSSSDADHTNNSCPCVRSSSVPSTCGLGKPLVRICNVLISD